MAYGGLLRAPYEAVVGLITWAERNWPFIDGKCLLRGVHLEDFLAPRFVHILAELYVNEHLLEKEVAEQRDLVRGAVIAKFEGRTVEGFEYDSVDEYGMSNDNIGPTSDEPLPYIEPTIETEDGFPGLDPPMG